MKQPKNIYQYVLQESEQIPQSFQIFNEGRENLSRMPLNRLVERNTQYKGLTQIGMFIE